MHDVVVIGAGASGVFFSLILKDIKPYLDILILEKNDKLGKKLLMTGNGRCNLGNEESSINNYYSSSKLDKFKIELEIKDFSFLDIMTNGLDSCYNYLNSYGILIKKEEQQS